MHQSKDSNGYDEIDVKTCYEKVWNSTTVPDYATKKDGNS